MNIPPQVRTDFNWNEEFSGIVTGYPVGARCEAPELCDRPVDWRADFHGCVQELACSHHIVEWAENIGKIIAQQGYVWCAGCDRMFGSAGQMVDLWLV